MKADKLKKKKSIKQYKLKFIWPMFNHGATQYVQNESNINTNSQQIN